MEKEDVTRPTKITLREMRASGVRGLLICCADYRCSHSITMNCDAIYDSITDARQLERTRHEQTRKMMPTIYSVHRIAR